MPTAWRGVIADNRHKLRGILNGIDTEVYDPWRDKGLTKFFSARQMAGKKNCKAALQQMSGLRENPDAPHHRLRVPLGAAQGLRSGHRRHPRDYGYGRTDDRPGHRRLEL